MKPRSDPAIDALISQLRDIAGREPSARHLWVADEHELPSYFYPVALRSSLSFFTNRYDQHLCASEKSVESQFTDMDFSAIGENKLEQVFFRVAKERAVVHRVINESHRILIEGGTLWLAGHKNEGIKTHISRAEERFGTEAKIERMTNQLFIASITNSGCDGYKLDDKEYANLREITVAEETFYSKPGLYGWNKVDQGSRILMEQLLVKPDILKGKQVLDLGCGYGYISTHAFDQGAAAVTGSDNCCAALAACEANLSKITRLPNSGLKHQVLPSDAGAGLKGTFDLILCNPPFHQGFTTTPELHRKFLSNTRRLLSPKGLSCYVLNQFLNIDQIAQQEGLNTKEVFRSESYKIIDLTPK